MKITDNKQQQHTVPVNQMGAGTLFAAHGGFYVRVSPSMMLKGLCGDVAAISVRGDGWIAVEDNDMGVVEDKAELVIS